ncbi:GumC family protein [Flavobacterium pedocola]
MQEDFTEKDNPFDNGLNLQEQIHYYIRNWKWFFLSVFLVLSTAYIYLRYSIPQYKAATTLMLKDEKRGGVESEQSAFSDLGVLASVKSNLDNEIEVIKSLTMIKSTVKELGLNVSYINEGRVKSEELYRKTPVNFIFSRLHEQYEESTIVYKIVSETSLTFLLLDREENVKGKYHYGETIHLKEGDAVVLGTPAKKNFKENPFKVMIMVRPVGAVAGTFKSRLNIAKIGERTSVVELSIVDPVREKAEDFLNGLIKVYNEDVVNDKNLVFENTSRFINERLRIIAGELEDVEKNTENFKRSHHVTDIASEASLFLANASEFERKEIETETQLKVVATMMDYVKENDKAELIPTNVLTSDANASGLIDQHNQLVLERNRLLKNAAPKNVVIQTIDKKIEALKLNIQSSLARLKSSLQIKKQDLAYQNAIFNGKISKIPTIERESKVLGRQQQIKESLYLYLLQKREETAISLAVTAPNAKVIDPAISSKAPIAPQKGSIYLMAFAIALILPFSILYLLRMMDNKVKGRHDVESKLSIPFLGDIPTSQSHEEVIEANSRSNSAEAIRIIRTNLEFMLNQVPDNEAKTIFVTSTLPKEGKTFVAVNLACTIALSGKKVLLIGMDIRNPKLEDYLHLPKEGVTNYLSGKDVDLDSLIHKIPNYNEFYVLPSGVIPPNPAELLMSQKVGRLFEKFKKEFDYIIVDTSPVHLVTDTMLISHHAHSFIYVIRANYLDKQLLRVPYQLYKEKKMPNMSILLNDTNIQRGYGYGYGAYGYGYGYGVEVEKKSWLQLLKDKLFKKEV